MTGAAARKPIPWTVERFRSWIESRPEEERWELIDGVAILMTPPTLAHQLIARNLEHLLNDALEKHDIGLVAVQRPGIDLGPHVANYQPEPDVAVIDTTPRPDQRYARQFYLAAEVISATDNRKEGEDNEAWAEKKRVVYRNHPTCTCVLVIEQHLYEVRLDVRTGSDWTSSTLRAPDALLELPQFGFRCRVAELYRHTWLDVQRPAPRR